MVYFHGADCMANTLSVTFDYNKSQEEEVMNFVREKLGEHVTIEELSAFVEELQNDA